MKKAEETLETAEDAGPPPPAKKDTKKMLKGVLVKKKAKPATASSASPSSERPLPSSSSSASASTPITRKLPVDVEAERLNEKGEEDRSSNAKRRKVDTS